jgi:protease-4
MLSPFSRFSDEERKSIEQLMRHTYDLFVDRVAQGRRLKRDQVLTIAEGRVWTGSQALENGLIDTPGSLSVALERARKLASLPPGTKVDILPRPKSFMELLGETLAEPQTEVIEIMQRKASGRRALALALLMLDREVLAFAPILFEVK